MKNIKLTPESVTEIQGGDVGDLLGGGLNSLGLGGVTETMDAVLAPVSAWTALSLKVEEGDVQAIKTWLGYRYGLPKQIVEQTNLNVDAGKLTDDEIKKIETNLEKSY